MGVSGAQPAVHVVGLRKSYGSTRAVDGISFQVAGGEIFGIVGPKGAGKTTTIECLEGLRVPDDGAIRVLGLDPQVDGAALRERIGAQLQQSALLAALRALPEVRRVDRSDGTIHVYGESDRFLTPVLGLLERRASPSTTCGPSSPTWRPSSLP